jgi:D-alanyl-D-alanine dipeptidase
VNPADVVLIGDPRIVAVPLEECGERFADFRNSAEVFVDESQQYLGWQHRYFSCGRIALVERVAAAACALPPGLAIKIVEVYRPPQVQRTAFAKYRAEVQALRPELDAAALDLEASRFIAPISVAPHPTGAAVDLTLCDERGNELDMGTSLNDVDWSGSTRTYTDSTEVSLDVRQRRKLLADALRAVGLVNYPSEWWHWSFGDRYWAWATKAPCARYGVVEEDALAEWLKSG